MWLTSVGECGQGGKEQDAQYLRATRMWQNRGEY
jgi:hypothetical protein